MPGPDQYRDLGVSSGKEGVHAAVKDLDKGLFPNAFCKVMPDRYGKSRNKCSVAHPDTAGTKAAVAWMMAKETGDMGFMRRLPRDPIIMNLGDVACVGAVGREPIVLTNTIDRNPFQTNDEMIRHLIEGGKEYVAALRAMGIEVYIDAGETADVGDLVGTLDIGYSASLSMPRSKVIEVDIREGDYIVGLASSGQATYEDQYNSGIASNGLTHARHHVLHHDYLRKYPQTVNRDLSKRKAYRGKLRLEDTYAGLPVTVGEALTSPTRNFLPVLQRILAKRNGIHGIIHNTGGGQTKVGRFLPPDIEARKEAMMPVPPVFLMIQEQSRAAWREMYKNFNMGHLMELYVHPRRAESVIAVARSFGIEAKVIGACHRSEKPGVRVRGEHGEHFYPRPS